MIGDNDNLSNEISDINTDLTSISSKVDILEADTFNHVKWLGQAIPPVGEVTRAAQHGPTGTNVFGIATGSGAWSTWLQILGSGDTPIITGKSYFALDSFVPESCSVTAATYIVQIVSGESSGIAAKLAANDYTTLTFHPSVLSVFPLKSIKYPAGTKLWARAGYDASGVAILGFLYSIKEYD